MHASTATASPSRYARHGQIGDLNTQWRDHYADRGIPKAWTAALPEPPATYGQLLADIAGGTRDRADRLLHSLLTLHRGGDTCAGRVVLQVMLGSTHRLIGTAAARHLDDPAAEAIAATWATISTYPLHRTTSVAANVALDALKALPRPDALPIPAGDALVDHIHSTTARVDDGDLGPDHEAVELLQWAHTHDILDADTITLLARVYLGQQRADYPTLALEYQLSQPALRKRISRAVARLAEAVSSSLASPQI